MIPFISSIIMRSSIILSALLVALTQAAPALFPDDNANINTVDGYPTDIDTSYNPDFNSPSTEIALGAVTATPQVKEGVAYPAPENFKCPSPSDTYCSYHNWYFYICIQNTAANPYSCYLGRSSGSPYYQTCADVPIRGTLCANTNDDKKPISISDNDNIIWKFNTASGNE